MTEPLHAVVLAAGAARRFGGGKLAAPFRGRPLIHHALDSAFAAPVAGISAVLGGGGDGVRAAVESYPRPAAPPLRLVDCPDWEEGLAASLRAGIASLPPCAGAYVFLGDMPAIPTEVLAPLARAFDRGALASAPSYEGQLGHPVLIGAALFDAIAGLRGDRGARAVLNGSGSALAILPVDDPGVLLDVDRPDALAALDQAVAST